MILKTSVRKKITINKLVKWTSFFKPVGQFVFEGVEFREVSDPFIQKK